MKLVNFILLFFVNFVQKHFAFFSATAERLVFNHSNLTRLFNTQTTSV